METIRKILEEIPYHTFVTQVYLAHPSQKQGLRK